MAYNSSMIRDYQFSVERSVKSRSRGVSGFTLIELMVTLVVFSILLLVAVPNFRDLLLNNRGASQINDLVASLSYARSEAIKRGVSVSACSSNDGVNCNAGPNWHQGWIIGVYDTATAPALNPVLKQYTALEGNVRLTKNGSVAAQQEVRFDRNGFAAGFNSTFKLCPPDNDANKIRAAVVAATGRIRLAEDTNNNGIVESDPGNDLSCSAPSRS